MKKRNLRSREHEAIKGTKKKGKRSQRPLTHPPSRVRRKNQVTALRVERVDPRWKANAKEHHTEAFGGRGGGGAGGGGDDGALFLRRGQPFEVELTVDRPYDEDGDAIALLFEFVPRASTASEAFAERLPTEQLRDEEKLRVFSPEVSVRGVRGSVLVAPDAKTNFIKAPRLATDSWDAVITRMDDTRLRVQVMVPVNAQVGFWKVTIKTKRQGSSHKTSIVFDSPLLVLFNPWCPEDLVYMEDRQGRAGHVVKDCGQYKPATMECVMYLLGTVSRIRPVERANPIHVARALCRGLNSDGGDGSDDGGLLVGNWDDTSDGVAPYDWESAAQIFEHYLPDKTPVKYGECFNFALILMAACRAVGLGCRSVWTDGAAVDADLSCTVEEKEERGMEGPLAEYRGDFRWNFHVWNDVWMTRPDLPEGFGGWQALDSCPVRAVRSGVLTQLGPAPIKAIKEGYVGIGYDSLFFFSAVNADVMTFKDDKLYNIITDQVGSVILSEKILSEDDEHEENETQHEDITLQYKYPEGSAEERAAVRRALCHVQFVYGDLEDGVVAPRPPSRRIPLKAPRYGRDVLTTVRFDNLSSEKRLVKYQVVGTRQVDEEAPEAEMTLKSAIVNLEPHKSKIDKIAVDGEKYKEKLKDIPGDFKLHLTVAVTRP